MIVKDIDGKEVEVSVAGTGEEPEIIEAVYVETGFEVDDAMIDWLYREYAGELSDEAVQYQVMRAEAWRDAKEDR